MGREKILVYNIPCVSGWIAEPQQSTKRAANSHQLHLHNVYFYSFLQLVLCSESVQHRVATADADAVAGT